MSASDNKDLIERVLKRDLRAVARAITLAENRIPRAREIQSELFKHTGNAHIIGVTGSPGAGKSTLVDQLAELWAKAGKKVAVLAVDPTSPFSGGAILGDRVRMNKTSEHKEVYIRSMATRGSLGGLSRGTLDAIQILDAAGFELILVETVGVGQAEVDIVRTADTCVVVLVPGMGDSVQAFKAGLLEIADLFVINKADRDGADILQKDLRILLSVSEFGEGDWKPPILRTVATTGDGTAELTENVTKHYGWLASSGQGLEKKKQVIEANISKLVTDYVTSKMLSSDRSKLDKMIDECLKRQSDPYTVAEKLVKSIYSK